MTSRTLEIDLPDQMWAIIDRLVKAHPYVEDVNQFVTELLDHVQQGVYRSGSWERNWLAQCTPCEAIEEAYIAGRDPSPKKELD